MQRFPQSSTLKMLHNQLLPGVRPFPTPHSSLNWLKLKKNNFTKYKVVLHHYIALYGVLNVTEGNWVFLADRLYSRMPISCSAELDYKERFICILGRYFLLKWPVCVALYLLTYMVS